MFCAVGALGGAEGVKDGDYVFVFGGVADVQYGLIERRVCGVAMRAVGAPALIQELSELGVASSTSREVDRLEWNVVADKHGGASLPSHVEHMLANIDMQALVRRVPRIRLLARHVCVARQAGEVGEARRRQQERDEAE